MSEEIDKDQIIAQLQERVKQLEMQKNRPSLGDISTSAESSFKTCLPNTEESSICTELADVKDLLNSSCRDRSNVHASGLCPKSDAINFLQHAVTVMIFGQEVIIIYVKQNYSSNILEYNIYYLYDCRIVMTITFFSQSG